MSIKKNSGGVKGDEMFYVAIFDFALAGLGLATFGFFVLCWVAFGQDRKMHPIYRQAGISVTRQVAKERAEGRCA
ncbi:MAG TPA: hypothetical protein VNX88_03695 [Terriglobales bacterium]|nr:hypothetical protein [Terriglobales bacterium]